MMPRYSSPPGTFTAISPDHDLDRSLYIGNSSHPASDRYSAPSPSQQVSVFTGKLNGGFCGGNSCFVSCFLFPFN